MVKTFQAVALGGLLMLSCAAQLRLPAYAQSEATSEADSEASSEASSQASSQASLESALVYGPTGYQVFQPWPRSYMLPTEANGYQVYQPWPPSFMLPLAGNGYPAWSQVDPTWVYPDQFAPALPERQTVPVRPIMPPYIWQPRPSYGLARVIPHAHRSVRHRR